MVKEMFINNALDSPSIIVVIIQFSLLNNEDNTSIFFELVLENTGYGLFPSFMSSVYNTDIFSKAICKNNPVLYFVIFFTIVYLY